MRWLIVILLGVLALVVVVGAVVLVPPHLQIRQVAPALPGTADLRSLLDEENGPVGIRVFVSSTQPMQRGQLGHSIFFVEWADGRLFMIDAGMDRDASMAFGEVIATLQDAGEVEFEGTSVDALGDSVSRVRGVGFTHLHTDHVQGIDSFCAARGRGARVYQTDWQAKHHNLHTVESAERLAASCLEAVTLEREGLLTTPDFPGLGIVALGGHTPGSTLFAVPVDGRLWLISGDISNVKANLLDNVGKGVFYSYLVVPEDTARTEALRVWLASLDADPDFEVVVSHDVQATASSGMEAIALPLDRARAVVLDH